MKVVGYKRVSTQGQVRDGISLELQENKIRAYCELNDLELTEIIEDAGLSGKNVSGRPGVQHLLGLIQGKKIDAVVVYKLDRLGRSTQDLLEIATLLEKKGIALHSLTEKLDTSTALGRFFFTLTGSLAELERMVISERTRSAMSQLRVNRKRISGQAEFGYKFDTDGNVVEDSHEQAIISRIRELSTQGMSIRHIQAELTREGYLSRNGNALSISTIHGILRKAA
ncbi:MAG: recombinase family protein [Desulfomonilaceae bacterium]